jgi:hypothetical protein
MIASRVPAIVPVGPSLRDCEPGVSYRNGFSLSRIPPSSLNQDGEEAEGRKGRSARGLQKPNSSDL